MIRKTAFALMLAAAGVNAHAALSAGDIAFTAFNADEDGWAIVALTDIAASSTIYFSDNTWSGSGFANTEMAHAWSSGSNVIGAGTVIRFSQIDNGSALSASVGNLSMVASTNVGFSATNETLYAYLGSAWNAPSTFLTAISSAPSGFNNATYGVLTNTGLSVGDTAIAINSGADYGQYNGVRTGEVSFSAYRSAINNVANWAVTTTGDNALAVPDTTAFTVTAVPEPKSYAMLFAGLGLMGFMARRRSR